MRTFSCLIIDDDDIDRLAVIAQVKKYATLELSGAFKSAAEAMPLLEKSGIDVLFLDIDMPMISGLEVRKLAMHVPVCVFITSHPEHATRTFELDTLDFIEKPVRSERFAQTARRIEEYMILRQKAALFDAAIGTDPVYVKDGFGKTRIDLHEVRYLEALKDYTKLALPSENHSTPFNLGNLLQEPEYRNFVRIHRSYAVNRHFVKRIKATEVLLDNGVSIPVGRSYKDILSTEL
ncbi:LytTR family transcriptional regulator [Flavobacterium longum]|uniref:LytR/AlgR family response regulator transcription factor n=1 Tax=Flavobacterium longum TaxID=1299340 RepID=UPI0039EC90F9